MGLKEIVRRLGGGAGCKTVGAIEVPVEQIQKLQQYIVVFIPGVSTSF